VSSRDESGASLCPSGARADAERARGWHAVHRRPGTLDLRWMWAMVRCMGVVVVKAKRQET